MASAPIAFRRLTGETAEAGTSGRIPGALIALVGALAASGLAELVLQRVVYRVGLHLPRDGTFQEAYRLTTLAGDFAFRLAAVLLLLASIAALVWLLSHRTTYITGLLLGALILANALAWPLAASWAPILVQFVFVFTVIWLIGRHAATRHRGPWFAMGAGAAGVALALAHYGSGMTELAGQPQPFDVATLQLISEVLLLASAMLLGWVALGRSRRAKPVAAGMTLALLLFIAYLREPATVAITSLWAMGITMSLPGFLYIAAFAAAVTAVLSWLSDTRTRHLAVGVTLLVIAGLEPQALHHSLTAALGLVLLYLAPPVLSARNEREEVHV